MLCSGWQTKRDFTTRGGLLLSLPIPLLIKGLLLISKMVNLLPHSKMVNVLYAALGALIFSAYLVCNIQLLIAGKTVQLSPDNYVAAALVIYVAWCPAMKYLMPCW